MSNGEAFTKPQQPAPEDFDVEAWLSGASLREKHVTVYGDGAGYGQLEELLERYEQALDDAEDDESLGAVSSREQFRTEYEALRQRVEASRRTFIVRAATSKQTKAVRDRLGDDATEFEVGVALVAASCVQPKLTTEQAERMADLIGIGQMSRLIAAANEATFAAQVEIPTLPASLRSRETQD